MVGRGKNLILVFSIIILFSVGTFAQFKSQVKDVPTLEQAIKYPGNGNNVGLNLFDPSRFTMNQSYSLMMGIGKGSGSMGMYLNNMSYMLSNNLMVNARLGFVHNPMQMGNTMTGNLSNNLIYGADILYKPFENMRLKLSFDKRPSRYNYYMNPYSYYGLY